MSFRFCWNVVVCWCLFGLMYVDAVQVVRINAAERLIDVMDADASTLLCSEHQCFPLPVPQGTQSSLLRVFVNDLHADRGYVRLMTHQSHVIQSVAWGQPRTSRMDFNTACERVFWERTSDLATPVVGLTWSFTDERWNWVFQTTSQNQQRPPDVTPSISRCLMNPPSLHRPASIPAWNTSHQVLFQWRDQTVKTLAAFQSNQMLVFCDTATNVDAYSQTTTTTTDGELVWTPDRILRWNREGSCLSWQTADDWYTEQERLVQCFPNESEWTSDLAINGIVRLSKAKTWWKKKMCQGEGCSRLPTFLCDADNHYDSMAFLFQEAGLAHFRIVDNNDDTASAIASLYPLQACGAFFQV